MNDYPAWQTLREIDAAAGTAKGTAFRRFRDLERELQAGVDYRVLHHAEDRETIASLRNSGRIYAGSVNVVLIAEALAQRIGAALQTGPGTSR
jgi:AcrR family transcriptional regulator